MNIGLMVFSAFITTLGLIFITKYGGRRASRYFKQFLAFLAIWPFLAVCLKLLVTMSTNFDNASTASIDAAEQMIALLPEFLISGYIGEAVGFVLWGIYHRINRLRKRHF
jgi:hypothetical protein